MTKQEGTPILLTGPPGCGKATALAVFLDQYRCCTAAVVLFFATSFGLALLANQKSAPRNELDLMIPETVPAVVEQAVDEELPVVDEEIPAMSAPAGEQEDLPALD